MNISLIFGTMAFAVSIFFNPILAVVLFFAVFFISLFFAGLFEKRT